MPENIFLLDTSALIEVFKPGCSEETQKYIRNLINENRIATTGIIEIEILGGANSQKEYKDLQEELYGFNYLDVNEIIWKSAAKLCFYMKTKGFLIPSTDCLIAAISIHYNCPVIHFDRHFDFIAKHSSLDTIKVSG